MRNLLDRPYFRWITLFLTSTTLLCCALPILLVTLGFGFIAAAMSYNIPGFSFLAEHKILTLTFSFLFLLFLAWIIRRPNQSCPIDPKLAQACAGGKKWNKRIFILSVIIWSLGFFASVLLLPLRNLLNL